MQRLGSDDDVIFERSPPPRTVSRDILPALKELAVEERGILERFAVGTLVFEVACGLKL